MTDITTQQPLAEVTIRAEHDVLAVSLELSRKSWLVTSCLPGSSKVSRHTVSIGDGGAGEALLALLARLQEKAKRRAGRDVSIVVIQEAGLDGFWIDRLLQANSVRSLVVDPASIATPRKRRRNKTDKIDGEILLRTLLAWLRGEPRVCSMVVPPSVEQEDQRRIVREREVLVSERTQHTNRIKGLLASQGITGFNPLRAKARQQLETLITGDGRPLPPRLKAELLRMLDRLVLLENQIKELEALRDELVTVQSEGLPAAMLMRLRSLGPQFAAVLSLECLFRSFQNRRQIASYAGLAASPWKSGGIDRDQGISKAGNPLVRKVMIELAWLWLRYQPGSALSQWFRDRLGVQHGSAGNQRARVKRITVVALARKLLIALWRFVTQGIVPEGATLKSA